MIPAVPPLARRDSTHRRRPPSEGGGNEKIIEERRPRSYCFKCHYDGGPQGIGAASQKGGKG